MQHFAYIRFALFALFASLVCTLATPVAVPSNETVTNLEKRATHNGRGTWYNVGLGHCGYTDVDSDPIVAISVQSYGNGANCNQWVRIEANGKTAYGKTRDSCGSCTPNDLDMSPSLFEKFAPLDTGVLSIKWNFMAKGWSP